MFPVVVVDVGVLEPPPQAEQALIDACTSALRQGKCVLTDSAGLEREQARAVAIVVWEEEQQRARVEVGFRDAGDREQWLSRQLRFNPIDERVERWRSVGLTIASLVGELPSAEAGEGSGGRVAKEPEPSDTTVPEQRTSAEALPPLVGDVATTEPQRYAMVFGELGVSAGPGLDEGPYRAGPYARFGYSVDTVPVITALGGSFAVRPAESRELRVRWITMSAEVGAYVYWWDTRFEATGVFLLQQIRAAAREPDGNREDSRARFLPGFGLRANAVWPARGSWALVLGVEGHLMADETTIVNAGRRTAQSSEFDGFLHLGLRLGWKR